MQTRERLLGPQSFGLVAWITVLVADQASKALVFDYLWALGHTVEVTSFFNLVVAWNTGVSFSFFAGGGEIGRWILIGVTGTICIGLAYILFLAASRYVGVAIGLILGGAVGNILDRVRIGAVYDFLDFHWQGWHWPAFNVADAGITVGACLLIFSRRPIFKNISFLRPKEKMT